MGYKQINNPCDFIIYKKPNILFLECKAIHGNTLNFKSHIRENQWQQLLQYSQVDGVNAGIICWFIDRDETYFIDITLLERLKQHGKKSFHPDRDYYYMNVVPINGKKKKVFFEYDLEEFLGEISYE